MIAADKKQRGEHCMEVVNAALKADNCTVNIFIILQGQRVPINMIIGVPLEISIDAQ